METKRATWIVFKAQCDQCLCGIFAYAGRLYTRQVVNGLTYKKWPTCIKWLADWFKYRSL